MQSVVCEPLSSDQVSGDPGGLVAVSAGQGRPGDSSLDWRLMLAKVVSSEIVPRLMMMQQGCAARDEPVTFRDTHEDITYFTRCLLASDSCESQSFIEKLERHGVQPDVILLEVFAPAARKLGELWTSDQCDFVQVSIGLHRLQSFMDDICSHLGGGVAHGPDAPSILLLSAPGETHEFGLAMVGNFFRADGWRVTASSPSSVLHQIHARSYQVLGISLSCTRHLRKLPGLIADARRLSRNRSVRLIVGGSLFSDPSLALELGADGTAMDAQGAVQLARSLLDANKVCESARTDAVSI